MTVIPCAFLNAFLFKVRQHSHFLTALGFFLLYSGQSLLWAQVSATLSGTVSDPSGAVVSAATVVVRNEDTGAVRQSVTDTAGRYQLSALPVGHYELKVNQSGFAEEIRTGINLVVGEDAQVDLSLRLGTSTQQVTVNEDAAIVNVTAADISGLVGERQVKDLPLNGRSYDELLTLSPGVVNFTAAKTGGIGVSNSTVGNNFAVAGNRLSKIYICSMELSLPGLRKTTCSRAARASNYLAWMRSGSSMCFGILTAQNTANILARRC